MLAHPPYPHNVIARGPNAGQLRPLNDIMLDRLRAAMDAVIILKRNGFHVIDIDHMKGLLPRVWIENGSRCAELQDAFTVKWATDADGPYHIQEHRLGAVRVCWIVRGH